MGMSQKEANARAINEARRRLARHGRRAPDLCIEEYLALAAGHPRRPELTKVISALSLM
jgi:hypothetical protein